MIIIKNGVMKANEKNTTSFTGTINNENEGSNVSVTIDDTSKRALNGNVYLTSLTGNVYNIITNSYKVYVNGEVNA